MRPQRGASCHYKCDTRGREYGQQRDVSPVDVLLSDFALAHEQDIGCGHPVDGAGPIADEGEHADGEDVKIANAIVRAGQVYRGDGVGAAKGEVGGVLQEEGRGRQFGEGEVLCREELKEHVEQKEERDVGGTGLGHAKERVEVMQRLDGDDALGNTVSRHDVVDNAGGGKRETDKDSLGTHDKRAAVGEVNKRPSETRYELWGVLVRESKLERKGSKNKTSAAGNAKRGREAIESLEQLAMDPEVGDAN